MEPDGSRPFRDLINTYIDATEDDSLTWNQQDHILDEVETLIRQKVETGPDLLDAAPDMLAALEKLERRVSAVGNAFYGTGTRKALEAALTDWVEEIKPIRAMIAKAKGETP